VTTAGRRAFASTPTPDPTPDPTQAARIAATAAVTASGVEVVAADSLELQQQVLEVVDRIWRPPPGEPVITLGVLRAMVHAGNYCSAALLDGRLVGVCLGFLGDQPPRSLHSHIAGVTRAGEGRHIGYALKLHQRAWALDRGLDTVTWTFDPLIRRNAYFNTVNLAARPV
jgi:predicted GNAT superfamily acetyltransferase